MIGCNCHVCKSTDPKDKRLRCSALIEYGGLKIIIDCGPDFRQQMLRENINSLDAILLTHQHKDHTGGLDDVRSFNYFTHKAFPIYCEERVEKSLEQEYSYVFAANKYPGIPDFDIHIIDENPFEIKGIKIIPVRLLHYKLPILGFRIGDMAYITDGSKIEDSEIEKIKGVNVFVINAIRHTKHISHFSLPEALEVIKKVGARQSYITHMSHQIGTHEELKAELPEGVLPAYDGLKVEF
jgi:phosphoribosyl 1,2-cyclic phosphate phosphodiesterase